MTVLITDVKFASLVPAVEYSLSLSIAEAAGTFTGTLVISSNTSNTKSTLRLVNISRENRSLILKGDRTASVAIAVHSFFLVGLEEGRRYCMQAQHASPLS